MKQQVRVIKTQRDYEAAIARLSSLMDEDVSPGSAKEAELELWALVIESYESNRVGPAIPDPIEAIIFRMDQQGLGKKDLVPYFGSLSKVSEVLSRKRPLSLAMIRKIHQGLGISAEVLLGGIEDEGINLSEEPGYDYTKFPWQEMLDRKFFPDFMGTVRQAKERGEELFRDLIRGIANQAPPPAYLRARMHQSGSRIMNEYALLVWQIAVLKKARSMNLPVVYKQGSITDEWLRDLAKLSSFEKGPLLAQEYLANAGIAFVVEEHFKKTYLDGAAMLDGETPVVALTLRHDRLDNFWFALIHELVHVQRHLDASLTREERDSYGKTGFMGGAGLAALLFVIIPDWLKSNYGWNIEWGWGLGGYCFAIVLVMAFAGGVGAVRFSEQKRLQEPPRFFRHSIK